jgi:cytochrome P450
MTGTKPPPQESPSRSPDFDPLASESFDSPHELYAQLRGGCPVAWSTAWNGFWALLRYDDVRRAASDARTYITSVQNVVPKVAFTGRRPPLHLDPPEHTPYRRALNPLLSEAAVARLETPIRSIVAELLEPLLARGEGDICADFASHLTIRVFAAWMNLSEEDARRLSAIGRSYNLAVQSAADGLVKETSLQLYDIAKGLIAQRRAKQHDPDIDPVAALLAARHQGAPLPEEMLIGTVRQVLVVGIIAPTILVGSIVTHLCREPDLQWELRTHPWQWPAALEEFLRLYTPYRGFARTCTREVTLHGRTIRPGEPIALVYASANRDEAVFPHPHEFVLNRPNIGEHLAFGRGPHHCVGSALARLELRLALQLLLTSTSSIELAGPVTPTRMPEIGALSVPVRLKRA